MQSGNRNRAALAGALALALAGTAAPAGAASFGTAPSVPSLPTLTLNAHAQTLAATMNNFSVALAVLETGGFNITVNGDSSTGHSAVFKVYCPNATCGSDTGPSYVSGGATFAANSLTLNTTGASWTGGPALTPSFLCNSGCSLDTATAVKIASEAAGGLDVLGGTWSTTGFGSTSVSLAVPTTTRAPVGSGEVYRLDLIWTLSTGP